MCWGERLQTQLDQDLRRPTLSHPQTHTETNNRTWGTWLNEGETLTNHFKDRWRTPEAKQSFRAEIKLICGLTRLIRETGYRNIQHCLESNFLNEIQYFLITNFGVLISKIARACHFFTKYDALLHRKQHCCLWKPFVRLRNLILFFNQQKNCNRGIIIPLWKSYVSVKE